jgi:hypothetical protein
MTAELGGLGVVFGLGQPAMESAEMYVQLSAKWMVAAQSVLQGGSDDFTTDNLAAAYDEVGARRAKLTAKGFGQASTLSAAAEGFVKDFNARLDSMVKTAASYIPSPGTAAVLLLAVVAILAFSRR